MPRVLVAQIGARRRYAVPRGLAQAGCLHRVVTDACNVVSPWKDLQRILPPGLRPKPLSAVLDRGIEGVVADHIRGCLTFYLAARLGRLRVRSGEDRISSWVRENKAFGRAVSRLDWGGADTVYAFNGAALEIFQHARQRGLRCILDQTAAPWRFNTELLAREKARWPGWEDHPADMDLSGRMIAREEAEWELADRIICGSPFVVQAIRSIGGPVGKCVIVSYPMPSIPAFPKEKLASKSRRLRVLFVGTLQLRKGIQYVWDTASRLGSDDFEFRAVGPSNLTPGAESSVGSRMDWWGRVAKSDMWKHYHWADVLFLPTLSEGSANACWEALAAGTSVVTTAAAGVVGVGALVSLESESMVAHLRNLASQPRNHMAPILGRRSVAEYGADLLHSLS